MKEQNDILKILSDSISRNNHQRIDRICDSIAMLSLGQLKHAPVFYRENMIIIRKDFLCRLLNVAGAENSMRAAIYVLLCLLALHTPAVTTGEAAEDNSNPDNCLGISLGDDEIIGVNKEMLTNNFGLTRNTVSLAMKLLRDKLGMVITLPDGTYGFFIPVDDNETPILEFARAKENLECILELMTVFQQADLLTSLKCEETDDDSEGFGFADEAEATEIVSSILEYCTITRWQDELLNIIRENDGEYYNEAAAKKIAELIQDNPLASSCGDFILLRQELLNYIILHGYRRPLFTMETGEECQISKAAMIILLYMLIRVDEEGYLRKDDMIGYTQAKDIATDCNMREAAVSKAMRCWRNIGIVQQSSKKIRFCNRLATLQKEK